MLSTVLLPPAARLRLVAVLFGGLLALSACSSGDSGERVLNVGFYPYFAPVSYSASPEPGSEGFDIHLGYEADLLSALEAMPGARLSFSRSPINDWPDIWLQSAGADYDIVGGGITALDSRTRNRAGETVVAFTSGHIVFRQSLLVRAEDALRLAGYDDLTEDVRVGVLAGTTGEARLLQLTGLAGADGTLAPGTRTVTPRGTVVADGGPGYTITAAKASDELRGRRHLFPPAAGMPQVVYLGEAGEEEMLEALRTGEIDAIAGGDIDNQDAAAASRWAFVVTALDEMGEVGGFTVAVEDAALLASLNEKIDWLTDDRSIGYAEWLADPTVFMKRAELWNG